MSSKKYILTILVFAVFCIPIFGEDELSYTSKYTNLTKDCKEDSSFATEGQDIPIICKGYGTYKVEIHSGEKSVRIGIFNGTDAAIPVAEQDLTFLDKERMLEWRFKNGKPFAIIFRIYGYKKDKHDQSVTHKKARTREILFVKGLRGFEHIRYEIETNQPNANQKARDWADGNS